MEIVSKILELLFMTTFCLIIGGMVSIVIAIASKIMALVFMAMMIFAWLLSVCDIIRD